MQRVLMIADSLEGGMGQAVLSGARWLEYRGWDVALAAPHDTGSWEGFPVASVAVPPSIRHASADVVAARQVRALTSDLAPDDVVHCHGLRSFAITRLFGRTRAFVTLHGSGPTDRDPAGFAALRRAGLRIVPRLARDAFSAVPGVGGGWQFAPHASPWLSHDLGSTPITADEAAPTFVWVGRLDVPKRPDVFVRALALAARRTRVRGQIIGGGPLLDSTRALAGELDAPVELLGARPDVMDHLAPAHALVLVSDFEAVPFVVQEAMWLGRSVVSSRLPGVRWLAGDTARYADTPEEVADALVQLADRDTALARGRDAARRIRSRLSPESPWPLVEASYVSLRA